MDTKLYDATLAQTKSETKAEQTAVGWCGQVVDTNGDGKITKPWNIQTGRGASVELVLYQGDTGGGARGAGAARGGGPGPQAAAPAVDRSLDTMVTYSLYSVIPSPVDDSVWGISETYPGILVRLQRGNNLRPCRTQIFGTGTRFRSARCGHRQQRRGLTALAASSHLASFDVRKCKDLTGPQKTDGSQCKEGWTLYQTNGPKLKGTDIPSDFHYYNWVDRANTSGLGANTPLANGSNSDSLIALNPQTKEWVNLRVPYPLGFYSRGMDGRIDNPNTGWKGRGLWANYGTHFIWHVEGGKGTKGKVVHFQVRPDPLAR